MVILLNTMQCATNVTDLWVSRILSRSLAFSSKFEREMVLQIRFILLSLDSLSLILIFLVLSRVERMS